MKYKTKNRTKIIDFLKTNDDKHLTIQEIQKHLPDIPQATLYRIIDSLCEEGIVRKYYLFPNSSCCFQYSDCEHEHQHFHLVCQKCGKLIHLDCDEVDHLIEHLKEDHNFTVDVSRVNLYGLCEDCSRSKR